jgi:hypothetical protein
MENPTIANPPPSQRQLTENQREHHVRVVVNIYFFVFQAFKKSPIKNTKKVWRIPTLFVTLLSEINTRKHD